MGIDGQRNQFESFLTMFLAKSLPARQLVAAEFPGGPDEDQSPLATIVSQINKFTFQTGQTEFWSGIPNPNDIPARSHCRSPFSEIAETLHWKKTIGKRMKFNLKGFA
jgi:hypothetical protein